MPTLAQNVVKSEKSAAKYLAIPFLFFAFHVFRDKCIAGLRNVDAVFTLRCMLNAIDHKSMAALNNVQHCARNFIVCRLIRPTASRCVVNARSFIIVEMTCPQTLHSGTAPNP